MERENGAALSRMAAFLAAFSPIQQAIQRSLVRLTGGTRSRGRKGPGVAILKRLRENHARRREARNRMAHESRRKNRGAYRGR